MIIIPILPDIFAGVSGEASRKYKFDHDCYTSFQFPRSKVFAYAKLAGSIGNGEASFSGKLPLPPQLVYIYVMLAIHASLHTFSDPHCTLMCPPRPMPSLSHTPDTLHDPYNTPFTLPNIAPLYPLPKSCGTSCPCPCALFNLHGTSCTPPMHHLSMTPFLAHAQPLEPSPVM